MPIYAEIVRSGLMVLFDWTLGPVDKKRRRRHERRRTYDCTSVVIVWVSFPCIIAIKLATCMMVVYSVWCGFKNHVQ